MPPPRPLRPSYGSHHGSQHGSHHGSQHGSQYGSQCGSEHGSRRGSEHGSQYGYGGVYERQGRGVVLRTEAAAASRRIEDAQRSVDSLSQSFMRQKSGGEWGQQSLELVQRALQETQAAVAALSSKTPPAARMR